MRLIKCDLSGISFRPLLFVLLLLSSSAVSLLTSPLASAASVYDNKFQAISSLEIGTEACGYEDISLTWSRYITDDFWWNKAGSNGVRDSWRSQFESAVANGRSWGVVQIEGTGGLKSAQVWWTDHDTQIDWGASGTDSPMIVDNDTSNRIRTVTIQRQGADFGDPCDDSQNSSRAVYDDVNSFLPLGTSLPVKILFLNVSDPNYPDDYAGIEIPNTYIPPGDAGKPEIGYTVDRYDFLGNYLKNLDLNTLVEGTENDTNYKVCWLVAEVIDGDVSDEGNFFYCTLPDEPFKYRFKHYGTYVITVDVMWRGSPYPGFPEEVDDFPPTIIQLDIDGSSYEGNTLTDDCSGGVCVPPSPYEDCSELFGDLDLIGGFGCVMRNFGTFLRILLTNMFLPRNGFYESFFGDISKFLEQKLGFIYQSIATLFSLLGGIITASATPNPILSPTGGTFFGTTVNFDMSYLEDNFPAMWTAIITIVRSATVLALIFAFYRKWHEVVDHR